jgi:uncharacterized protein YjbI with pentapeptide repeats
MENPPDFAPGTTAPLANENPPASNVETAAVPPKENAPASNVGTTAAPPEENPEATAAPPDEPRGEREDALIQDNDEKSTSFPHGPRRLARYAKITVLIVGGIIAYYQYLDQSIESTISREEALFSVTATQLDSNSEAVRASAVRTIYELAFRRTPIEAPPSPFSPVLNLTKWVLYPPEYRNFERCRALFQEFAAVPRKQSYSDRDMVSSEIIRVSIQWMEKQEQLLGIDRKNPDVWLLYRAQLSKAYAPSSQLQDVQFSDADISNAVLSESDFSRSNLQAANLESSNFESSKFRNTNLYGAHLKNAKLNFAVLESARLENADLSAASLVLVKAIGSSFAYANLQRAEFRSATLRSVNFGHSDLRRADFTDADLSDADLSNADLRGADLRFATGVDRVRSWTGTRTEGALLPSGFKGGADRRSE